MDLPRWVLIDRQTQEKFRQVHATSSENLYETLVRNGVEIKTSCRGSTICGRCWVQVSPEDAEALAPIQADEQLLLERHAAGVDNARLACRITFPKPNKAVTVATDYWSTSE